MSQIKKLFYDLETTGLDHRRHCIHQLYVIIEIDDKIVEEHSWNIGLHPKAEVTQEALSVCGKTLEELKAYPDYKEQFRKLKTVLKRHVDAYNKEDKFFLLGYNSNYFDNNFLTKFFDINKDNSFWNYFYGGPIDVMCLASEYLILRRSEMPSFKLHRVAKELGLIVNDDLTHDAKYDCYLTREIYRIVTGREVEL